MFELNRTKATLVNVNPRAERHGESRVPAFDLKMKAVCPATVLDDFNLELREALFCVPAGEDDALTSVRFPDMGTLKWEWEGTDYQVAFHDTPDVTLVQCEIGQIALQPLEGGSVEVGFRITCHPSARSDLGRICEMIQSTVEFSMFPAQDSLFGKEAA